MRRRTDVGLYWWSPLAFFGLLAVLWVVTALLMRRFEREAKAVRLSAGEITDVRETFDMRQGVRIVTAYGSYGKDLDAGAQADFRAKLMEALYERTLRWTGQVNWTVYTEYEPNRVLVEVSRCEV
jgi:uncharacterized protein (DUF58 family)